jgi:hypothetical protein
MMREVCMGLHQEWDAPDTTQLFSNHRLVMEGNGGDDILKDPSSSHNLLPSLPSQRTHIHPSNRLIHAVLCNDLFLIRNILVNNEIYDINHFEGVIDSTILVFPFS